MVKKVLSSFVIIVLLISMMTSVMLGRLTIVKADDQNTLATTPTPLVITASSDSNEDVGWPMLQHDPAHTGYSSSSTPPRSNQTAWNQTVKGARGVVVANGTVYVGSTDSNIYALNSSNGIQLWNYTMGGQIYSWPAVYNGVVYMSSNDNKVYALNAANGLQVWSHSIQTGSYSSPIVVNNVLYVSSSDNNIYALDSSNGAQLWNYTVDGQIEFIAYDKGIVCVGSTDGITALNATSGTKIWMSTSTHAYFPTIAYGMVYGYDPGQFINALDVVTGAKIWNFSYVSTANEFFGAANGILYYVNFMGFVFALNATTGKQIWSITNQDWHFTGYSAPLSIANSIVYLPHYQVSGSPEKNAFYALNASTGVKIWTYDLGNYSVSSTAIANGMVFISYNDSVLAFGQPTYQVTFSTSGSGTSSTNPSGTQTYTGTQQIPITAAPGGGYSFLSWSANPPASFSFADATSANTTVTIKGSGTINAIFTDTSNVPASISLSANPGRVSENPPQSSTIVATVLTKSGSPSQGINVVFTSNAGTLSQASLTNSQGQTQVTLTPNFETASPIDVTVTAVAGNFQGYTKLIFEPPASIFSISINPTSATISPGNSATTTVTVSSPPSTSQSVNIYGSDYPTNGNWETSQGNGNTPFTCTFTVNTNGYTSGNPTPPGTYTIPINANCQGVIETANFTVTVIADNEVTVSAGTGGSVSYTYNGNSESIQSAQNKQVQATAGTQISLTANPDSQHNFHNWITTGNVWVSDASSPTTKLNVAGDGSVTASFDLYTVTIVSAIGGQVTYISTGNSGTVDSGQQTTIQMNYGSSLSLGAIPATGYGYSFKGWISSSPSIAIASQSSQSTTATINGDGTITANFQLSTSPSVALSVSSSHGNPNPSVGTHSYTSGSSVTCSVSSPVTEGGATYVCTGWTGTGSAPQLGNSATTTFTITKDSSITWSWKIQQASVALSVSSSHGNPNPSVGTHSYTSGSSVICSVSSPVTENGVTYVCTGWTGTGSVPASGSGTSTTFTIAQDSSIAWNWAVQKSFKVLSYSISSVSQEYFYEKTAQIYLPPKDQTIGQNPVPLPSSPLFKLTGVVSGETFQITMQVQYEDLQNPKSTIAIPSLKAISSTPQNDANKAPLMGSQGTNGIRCALLSIMYPNTINQENDLLQSGVIYTLTYDCKINPWSIVPSSQSAWDAAESTALNVLSEEFGDVKIVSRSFSLYDIVKQLATQNEFVDQVTYNLVLSLSSSDVEIDYPQLLGSNAPTSSSIPVNSITVVGIPSSFKVNEALQLIETDQDLSTANICLDVAAIIATFTPGGQILDPIFAVASYSLIYYQYIADTTLSTLANDPSLEYTQYIPPPTEPAFISALPNNTATNLLRLEYFYYGYLNASVITNGRAAGALSQNSSYYAATQESLAIQYANNASSYYKMLVPAITGFLNELNNSGYWNENTFKQEQLSLQLKGVPQGVVNILQEMGLPTDLNYTELDSATYVPFNFNISSLPDIGTMIAEDENSTLTMILAKNNQSSIPSTSNINIGYLFFPLLAIVVIVAIILLIALKKRSKGLTRSPNRSIS